MVGMKLSAGAQLKMDAFAQARRKLDRIYALVEQYAGTGKGDDAFLSPISRTATEVARLFMQNGYGIMADHCNQIGMLAKRAGPKPAKLRTFRELVVAVRSAMTHAEKTLLDEERAAHEKPPEG